MTQRFWNYSPLVFFTVGVHLKPFHDSESYKGRPTKISLTLYLDCTLRYLYCSLVDNGEWGRRIRAGTLFKSTQRSTGRSFFYHGIKGLPVKARDSGDACVWEFSCTHYNKISIWARKAWTLAWTEVNYKGKTGTTTSNGFLTGCDWLPSLQVIFQATQLKYKIMQKCKNCPLVQ